MARPTGSARSRSRVAFQRADDRLDLGLRRHPGGGEVAPGRRPDHHRLLLVLLLHPVDGEVDGGQVVQVGARLDDQLAALEEGHRLVVVAAQDDVDALDVGGQRPVVGEVLVGQRHDQVGAHLLQPLDRGLGGGAWAGRSGCRGRAGTASRSRA